MNPKVGDTVYCGTDSRFDRKGTYVIESETSKSWVLEHGLKLPKKPQNEREAAGGYRNIKVANAGVTHKCFYFDKTDYDNKCWRNANQYAIGKMISEDSHYAPKVSLDALRQIAALIGYVEKP
jgi:hypothetical protein